MPVQNPLNLWDFIKIKFEPTYEILSMKSINSIMFDGFDEIEIFEGHFSPVFEMNVYLGVIAFLCLTRLFLMSLMFLILTIGRRPRPT